MDYFSVIVLVIVTFIFISDRNVKSVERINKEKTDVDLNSEINNIKEKMEILKLETCDMNYNKILNITKNSTKEYIFIQNNELDLDENDINTLTANYYISNKKPCAFNLTYKYQEKKWSLKKIYIDIINYLNIFNKNELSTYGVIICDKNNLAIDAKSIKQNLLSFTPAECTCIELSNAELKTKKLKKIYIEKINKADISIILKILLFIISGSIITTNLIYSILNANNNINGVLISSVIYFCYSYIIRYIYKPIGKQRVIATYIFPIYFISYILVGVYTWSSKVIKKVHAS